MCIKSIKIPLEHISRKILNKVPLDVLRPDLDKLDLCAMFSLIFIDTASGISGIAMRQKKTNFAEVKDPKQGERLARSSRIDKFHLARWEHDAYKGTPSGLVPLRSLITERTNLIHWRKNRRRSVVFFGHSITVDIQVSLARNSSFVVNNKFMEIHVELISALVAFPDAINTREAVAKSIWSCETGFEWRRDGCFGSCGVGDCGATSLLILLKFKKQIARFSTVIESHWQHWL